MSPDQQIGRVTVADKQGETNPVETLFAHTGYTIERVIKRHGKYVMIGNLGATSYLITLTR